MADYEFNTNPGETVARELLIAYLNTGTASAPVWSPIGKRVTDSSIEFDWSTESSTDILGDTYTTGKKATKTQSFDPWDLDAGDAAQKKIWNLAIKDNNVNALLNQDMLIAHFYAGTEGNFAERYASCSVLPTGLGGEGGSNVGMPIEVTYGGTRTIGTVTKVNGTVTFTEEAA
jgi:hypothetical protein